MRKRQLRLVIVVDCVIRLLVCVSDSSTVTVWYHIMITQHSGFSQEDEVLNTGIGTSME